MTILEQTQDGAIVKLKVEIPEEDLQPHFEKAFRELQKTLTIDGFRKGKVPFSIVKKRYGESVRWDAIDSFIKDTYPEILDKSGLRPITPGDIQDPAYEPGGPLTFTVVFELFPEVEIGDWKKMTVMKEKALITDADVDNYLETMRRHKAVISHRPDDEGAADMDRLTIDIQEVDAAGTVIVGHRRDDLKIDIGRGMLGENTDEQLIGVKKGEARTIKSKRQRIDDNGKEFTEDFGWVITVNSIEKVDLPELDADFATQVNPDFQSIDDLRKNVSSELEGYAAYIVNQRFADRLIDKIVEETPFDIPPSLLAETLEHMVQRHRQESEDLVSEDVLRKSLAEQAEKQLRWNFIKEKLIEDLELKATDEEVEKQLELRAEHSTDDLESLRLMFKSGEKREMLEREIIESKLMEVLANGVQVDERPVELMTLIGK